MLTLTINGRNIQTIPGDTVLEAAQQNGIDIPTLCHHPALRSVGACRLCMVEIEGMRGQPTACTTPAAEGMVVHTNTPALLELRREVLSLILSEHPYTCLVCERHERCNEWQVTIRKAGVTTGCENCPKNGQCELQNLVDKISLSLIPYSISYRGFPVEKEDPFFDRDYNLCILCGRCVRVCQDVRQTGTLSFVNRGPQTVVSTAFGQSHLLTNCEFCGSCVDVCPTGALYDKRTKWEGVPDTTTTTVCPYCSVGCQLDLWIKNGKVMGVRPNPEGPVNQGQACTRGRFAIIEMVHAPDRLRTPLLRKDGRLIEASWDEAIQLLAAKLPAYKGDAFAMLASPHLTSESAYILQKFTRQVMDSHNIDSPTALPRHARTSELTNLLRANHRAPIQSIHKAGCILAIGTNPRLSHPIVALYIRQAQAAGAKLIVIDPRRTELARRADVWLPVEPGADAALLKVLSASVNEYQQKGEGSGDKGMDEAAQWLTKHGPVAIVYGSGVIGYPDGPDAILAIQQLATSLPSKAGIVPLLGAANTLGVIEVGAVASDGDRNYREIVAGIDSGEIKALYLAGEMPALDALSNLELLIVQDTFLSTNVVDYASVVLPATSFAEMSGTLVNLEGRAQRFTAAIPPVSESRPDWLIVSQLARAMGSAGFEYQTASDVWREIEGIQYPVVSVQSPPTDLPNTNLLDTDLLDTDLPNTDLPNTDHWTLITERNQFSYRGTALTERVRGMDQVKSDEESIYIHPGDAARLGIAEGELVRVISEHGSDTFLARLSADVLPGTAFASINPAHGSKLFPAMLPDMKVYSVQISCLQGRN
jgi:predicted molibdopterin-dependent oxidoreductase YjgC